MKVPRDCSGLELARSLRRLGYEPVRQRGSHMVLTTQQGGEHHPNSPPTVRSRSECCTPC